MFRRPVLVLALFISVASSPSPREPWGTLWSLGSPWSLETRMSHCTHFMCHEFVCTLVSVVSTSDQVRVALLRASPATVA